MTMRSDAFQVGEWYHCFNRTLDKRVAFADARDFERFLELLYLANDETPLRRASLGRQPLVDILSSLRGGRLVSIGAYCLMPGHFHLALKEITPGGITSFMRKLGTAYTLYFNGRYSREGNLFRKPFQSFGVSEKEYKLLVSYVHANPTALYEPQWRTGHVVDPQFVIEHLLAYPYSSLAAHSGVEGPVAAILGPEVLSEARKSSVPVERMLREAREYLGTRTIP